MVSREEEMITLCNSPMLLLTSKLMGNNLLPSLSQVALCPVYVISKDLFFLNLIMRPNFVGSGALTWPRQI